jgi:tetratricopeptide (TPR) repeat protein
MLRRWHPWIVGLGLSVNVVLGVVAARAGKPIPSGKDVPTVAKWQDEVYTWRRQDVDSYKQLTEDPQEIRDEVVRLLEGYLQREFRKPDAPSWKTLEEQADALSARGAKDPLFQMCLGDLRVRSGKTKEGIAIARSAFQNMASTKYRPALKFLACYDWYLPSKSNAEFAEDLQSSSKQVVSSAVALLEATADQPQQRKFVWEAVFRIIERFHFDQKDRDVRDDLLKAVRETEKIDPWIKNVLAGREHIELAWRSQGSGYANAVTEDGWRGFTEHMQKAAECLTKAWALDPTDPDAAVDMIRVAGAAGIGDLSPRDWFDRAVEARIDSLVAYDRLLTHMLPKWGGSHESILEFGRECVGTGRFDTDVPYMYIFVIRGLDKLEFDERGDIWLRDGVYDSVKTLLEGMEKEPARSAESLEKYPPEWLLSLHGAVAGKVGKYDEAREVLDRVGKNLRKDAFPYVRSRYPLDFARVYALTGAARKDVQQFEDLLAGGKLSDPETMKSAAALLEAAEKATKEPEAKAYFDQRKTYVAWLRRYNEGQWVELTFDQDLSMWEPRMGSWRYAEPNSVIGSAMDKAYGRFVCAVPFTGPLEVDLDMAGLEMTRFYNCGVAIGDLFDPASPAGCLFWFAPKGRIAGINVEKNVALHNEYRPLLYAAHFRIQAWDNAYRFYTHDTELSPLLRQGMLLGNRIELVIRGLQGNRPGEARFGNIRVRKLRAPAPPMGMDVDDLAYFEKLIAERPDDGFLYYQRGQCHYARKQWEEAQSDFKKATELAPDLAMARLAWSRAAYELGDLKSALEQLDEGLKLRPDDMNALNAKAWMLATCSDERLRNGKLAVEVALKLCEMMHFQEYTSCETLACAHAESGDFDQAVKWAQKSVELAPDEETKKPIEEKITLFKSKRPYHVPAGTIETPKPGGG